MCSKIYIFIDNSVLEFCKKKYTIETINYKKSLVHFPNLFRITEATKPKISFNFIFTKYKRIIFFLNLFFLYGVVVYCLQIIILLDK